MKRRDFAKGMILAPAAFMTERLPRSSQDQVLTLNPARLNANLTALAQFGLNDKGGITRVAYSEADRQAREFVIGLMRAVTGDGCFSPLTSPFLRNPLEVVIFSNEENGKIGSKAMRGQDLTSHFSLLTSHFSLLTSHFSLYTTPFFITNITCVSDSRKRNTVPRGARSADAGH